MSEMRPGRGYRRRARALTEDDDRVAGRRNTSYVNLSDLSGTEANFGKRHILSDSNRVAGRHSQQVFSSSSSLGSSRGQSSERVCDEAKKLAREIHNGRAKTTAGSILEYLRHRHMSPMGSSRTNTPPTFHHCPAFTQKKNSFTRRDTYCLTGRDNHNLVRDYHLARDHYLARDHHLARDHCHSHLSRELHDTVEGLSHGTNHPRKSINSALTLSSDRCQCVSCLAFVEAWLSSGAVPSVCDPESTLSDTASDPACQSSEDLIEHVLRDTQHLIHLKEERLAAALYY
eukprot:Gregarina_sp_Poly_1__4090@NODE_2244_length_2417_cov_257_955319_g1440_i0_p1_GENE_NODE_2244_length_2417_cov_257_955319_g1440_i0NODE_2244_length_2417_cov_257_955319_g1440_i0_p1_ORF_typecomplete_len287_score17_59_NODE_2244_length_2417_cov_257_955319_g1440_i08981758